MGSVSSPGTDRAHRGSACGHAGSTREQPPVVGQAPLRARCPEPALQPSKRQRGTHLSADPLCRAQPRGSRWLGAGRGRARTRRAQVRCSVAIGDVVLDPVFLDGNDSAKPRSIVGTRRRSGPEDLCDVAGWVGDHTVGLITDALVGLRPGPPRQRHPRVLTAQRSTCVPYEAVRPSPRRSLRGMSGPSHGRQRARFRRACSRRRSAVAPDAATRHTGAGCGHGQPAAGRLDMVQCRPVVRGFCAVAVDRDRHASGFGPGRPRRRRRRCVRPWVVHNSCTRLADTSRY